VSETFEQIGKYTILAKLGQGAMGEVWRAHDPILGRDVAIKTISAAGGTDETLRKRFHREAQSAAHLNHPNIITVFDFGEEQGRIYMAMELLEGRDLKELITNRILSDLHDKLDIMEQICEGLAYAHSKDVVHRDLKPGNIHVQPGGQLKIMDFGLARLGASDMTREGMILGTPNYMSPEQVRGEKADARSDIFSVGAVFYELLTSHKPFDADSLHAVLFNVLQQDPEPVRKWAPDLPNVLVDLVEKALSKDPAERFQRGGEVRDALRSVRRALAEGWVGEATIGVGLLEREPSPRADASQNRSRASASRAPVFDGTAALNASRSAERRSGSGATLRSPATLHQAPATPPARTPPASRVPLFVGGGIAVAGLALAGYFVLNRAPQPAEKGRSGEQVGALTQALVGSQVELARRSLEDKDYKGAIAQAERALALDAQSADARGLLEKAKAAQSELEAAAGQARSAFDAGDLELASKALATLMVLDPKHPLASELSQKLGGRFRGQADEARRAMARSRAGAERAGAASLAPFAEAATAGREGEAAAAKGDFAVATQRFLAARDGFDRAARESAQHAAARPPAPVAVAQAPPTTVTALTLPPATTAPATLPPPTIAPAPPPPATAPPATTPPATAAASDEPAIRRIVADYGRAIETKDLGLFRTIKPNLSPDEEKRLQSAFEGIKSHQVDIQIVSIQVSGAQATVKLSRRDRINGNPVNAFQQTLVLAKGPAGWTIREIGR
jgi:serine/threonine protein kinase